MANENKTVETTTQATSQSATEKKPQVRYVKKDELNGKEQFRVVLLRDSNPKRGACALRFEWYFKHKDATVAQVLEASRKFAKGESNEIAPRADDLRWDIAHNHIRLAGPEEKVAAKK